MTLATALMILQAAAPTHSNGPATTVPAAAADSGLAHRGGVPQVVTAVRATPAPILDGRLDDPVWQIATPATGFRRDRPGDGLPAAEDTEVRVAYTSDALYIGARMYARDPASISRRRGRRDSFLQQNDQFQVQIDFVSRPPHRLCLRRDTGRRAKRPGGSQRQSRGEPIRAGIRSGTWPPRWIPSAGSRRCAFLSRSCASGRGTGRSGGSTSGATSCMRAKDPSGTGTRPR